MIRAFIMKICNLSTEDGNFIGLKKDGKLWISAIDNKELRGARSIDQALKLKIDPARLKENLLNKTGVSMSLSFTSLACDL